MPSRAPIYLDYQATTPVDARVLKAMEPYQSQYFGNPHSADHPVGWAGAAAMDVARGHVAALVNAQDDDVIFTSGATEANNTIIKGRVLAAKQDGISKPHILTTAIEHKCVLESVQFCVDHYGATATFLPVDKNGRVDPSAVRDALTDETVLLSVMAVNNEIGTIQPIAEVGQLDRPVACLFHVDAAQAAGKIHVDMATMHIDAISLSAHKMYGPKGIGALVVWGDMHDRFLPLMSGGGQEWGMRSGTGAPALAVGFGEAARLAHAQRKTDTARITELGQRLWAEVSNRHPDTILNGPRGDDRYWGNLSLTFPSVEGGALLSVLKGFALSSGAACASGSGEASYVLAAIGLDERAAKRTLRLGLGRDTDWDKHLIPFLAALDTAIRELTP